MTWLEAIAQAEGLLALGARQPQRILCQALIDAHLEGLELHRQAEEHEARMREIGYQDWTTALAKADAHRARTALLLTALNIPIPEAQ